MDTMTAFLMGEMHRNDEMKIFDWNKATDIILEQKPDHVYAGLEEDWSWTFGCIYEDGKPVAHHNAFLGSTWATPIMILDDSDDYVCYSMESEVPGWSSNTQWPDECLARLGYKHDGEEIVKL